MKAHRKRTIWILLALFLLPILVFGLWYGRQVRQQRLDHALIEAIKKDDTQKVIALLKDGADANAMDKPFKSPTLDELFTAFWQRLQGRKNTDDTIIGEPALCVLLGFDDTIRLARKPENTLLLQALLEHGANPDAKDKEGNPVSVCAEQSGYSASVRLLLKHGCHPDAADHYGNTLLHIAASRNDLSTIKLLRTYQADLNPLNEWGQSPLTEAHYESAQLLIAQGADVNARGNGGYTALMRSVTRREGDPDKERLLLEHGADPNVRDSDGGTPMMLTIEDETPNNTKDIRLLLQYGAKVSLKDTNNCTALDYAKEYGRTSVITLLQAALKKEQASKGEAK